MRTHTGTFAYDGSLLVLCSVDVQFVDLESGSAYTLPVDARRGGWARMTIGPNGQYAAIALGVAAEVWLYEMPQLITTVADAERRVWQTVGSRLVADGVVEVIPAEEMTALRRTF